MYNWLMPELISQSDFAYPDTVEELLLINDQPVVCINQESFFTYINPVFEATYGWSSEELLGKSVTSIMPEHMRNAHLVGFSRFVVTEKPHVIGKPLNLSVICKNGQPKNMCLFILGEKQESKWRFAAILKPEQ